MTSLTTSRLETYDGTDFVFYSLHGGFYMTNIKEVGFLDVNTGSLAWKNK
jgi:hypothetical protein